MLWLGGLIGIYNFDTWRNWKGIELWCLGENAIKNLPLLNVSGCQWALVDGTSSPYKRKIEDEVVVEDLPVV